VLEERYGLALRLLPSALWIVYYALFSGNAIYTLSIALQPVTEPLSPATGGISVNAIILIVGVGVIVYCAFSGMIAVAYSSVIQAFLIVLGGLILMPLCLKEVGGVGAFVEKIPEQSFVFWKPVGEAWPTYRDVVMFALLGLPYWFTSQYLLQRSFAGRTVRHASKGLILAALLTGPLTLSYIIPGMCGSILYTGDAALAKGDFVLPRLLVDVLPIGLGGLFVAALMAASNSTASALLNSLATLTEHDFYRRFLPARSSRHYIWVGRIATLVGGAVGLVFAFNVDRLGGIIQANFYIMSIFEPPIFVIVAAALFWRYVNAWGAALGVVSGVAFNAAAATFTEMTTTDRTYWVFPICVAGMVLGSVVGHLLSPRSAEAQAKGDDFTKRMRGPRPQTTSPWPAAGAALAALCLVAFIVCAVFEERLPKPGNLFVFMGLMMVFVAGCYAAVPLFVADEKEEAVEEVEGGGIEQTWLHRIFGSGWSWLALYVGATVLVLALYFL